MSTQVQPQVQVHTTLAKFKWDPKAIEIQTRTVEQILQPLVNEVTTLVHTRDARNAAGPRKKGRSRKAETLLASVLDSVENFMKAGKTIAAENPEEEQEMLIAVAEVGAAGEALSVKSKEFVEDPCSSVKRGVMVSAARALLAAVTRLLILADMLDVRNLMRLILFLESELDLLKNATKPEEIEMILSRLPTQLAVLEERVARRAEDLKDGVHGDALINASEDLKNGMKMLITTSKLYARNPDKEGARENYQYVCEDMRQSLGTMEGVMQATTASLQTQLLQGSGDLANALAQFDESLIIEPTNFQETHVRPRLENQLEQIVSGAALIADSLFTRDDHKEKIVESCNAVRQALQDLLSEYMDNAQSQYDIDEAADVVTKKTGDLRQHLRKAVADHVSDVFIDTNGPLESLYQSALNGDVKKVEKDAEMFATHAEKIIQVAGLVQSTSTDSEDGRRLAKALGQLQALYPQVINAAQLAAADPASSETRANLEAFKEAWVRSLSGVTKSVDDVTNIVDFLAVTESHILDDIKKCVLALQDRDSAMLADSALMVQARSNRVCDAVLRDLTNYQEDIYAERVREGVNVLRSTLMPQFEQQVATTVKKIDDGTEITDVDENEFIDASRLVYDGIRDIRCAVLTNQNPDAFFDVEDEDDRGSFISRQSSVTDDVDITQTTNTRVIMKHLPEDEREKINKEVEDFNKEKVKLINEVNKFDDSGNDLIFIAKEMARMMQDMVAFTKGKGPLKNNTDVINIATQISLKGERLNELAKEIANKCPEGLLKQDLQARLSKIPVIAHQLKMTSKVKNEVSFLSGELVISGLDSIMSLIQSAKNLIAAVGETINSCYIACSSSTMRRRRSVKQASSSPNTDTLMQWKMKPPEKKPLVKVERSETKGKGDQEAKPSRRVTRNSTRRTHDQAKELETVLKQFDDI
jgi:catenin alpha